MKAKSNTIKISKCFRIPSCDILSYAIILCNNNQNKGYGLTVFHYMIYR